MGDRFYSIEEANPFSCQSCLTEGINKALSGVSISSIRAKARRASLKATSTVPSGEGYTNLQQEETGVELVEEIQSDDFASQPSHKRVREVETTLDTQRSKHRLYL